MGSVNRQVFQTVASQLLDKLAPALVLLVIPIAGAAQTALKVPAPIFDVGDTWQYSFQDFVDRGKPPDINNEWVTGLNPDGSINIGRARNAKWIPVRLDVNGNYIDLYDWHFIPSLEYLNFPLFIGRSWRSEYRWTAPGGGTGIGNASATVVSLEHVKVRAGEFDAFKIDIFSQARTEPAPWITSVHTQVWYVPSVKRMVLRTSNENRGRDHVSEWRQELISYSIASPGNAPVTAADLAASTANP